MLFRSKLNSACFSQPKPSSPLIDPTLGNLTPVGTVVEDTQALRHTHTLECMHTRTGMYAHTYTPAPNSPCHYSPFSGEASSTFNSCAEFPWEKDLTFVLESKGKIRWQECAACGSVSPGWRLTLVPSVPPLSARFPSFRHSHPPVLLWGLFLCPVPGFSQFQQ